ncbi:MAG: Cro/Cl family transcriptional regulator [Sphingobacteriales bacterium]|nr:MAG: Cro/Cl family transcriptional regulator [Sphingobacteriales bacterium]
MNPLRAYLNSMPPDEQGAFARRCGTSIGYLRKAISKGQLLGEGLCINLERESSRAVRCEDLRVDVDWAFIRGTELAHADAKARVPLGNA